MPSIRKTKTASGAIAVQVVRYENRKLVVMKHVGSGHAPEEVAALVDSARVWMEQETKQTSLFPRKQKRTLPLATTEYLGVTHTFARATLLSVAKRCGFDPASHSFLLDFALMRIIEPASKLRSIALLERYFGVQYARRSVHRALSHLHTHKTMIEDIAVACAKETLHADLAMVLYDVTTLYFETFDADELRVQGFSKENKSQQPQIVVGLLVTKEGFPLGYEVFPGNTFEGKTMIPVLKTFTKKHQVTTPTVVADAAMLSHTNIAELKIKNISYIVGARLGTCSLKMIKQVSEALQGQDGKAMRIATHHGDLIVAFSAKRFRKHKADMDKQIAKGKALVAKSEPGRRAKFVQKDGKDTYVLNEALIEKTTLLLGLKGYYTNVPEDTLSNANVIARYHDLWHVEQAFRMAKSDLASRPIFHHKEDAVRAHMLICFVALVMGKYMELQTDTSLRATRDTLWDVTDATLVDTATGETFKFRSPLGEGAKKLLKQLGLSY